MQGRHARKEVTIRSRFANRMKLAVVGTGLIGSLMLSGGVFAAWSPAASVTSGSIDAANLAVTMADVNGTTFTTGVSNMLPGDYLNRYVDITNNGSVAQVFTGNITGAGVLSPVISAKVDTCSVAWSGSGCSGTVTSVLASTVSNPAAAITFPSLAVNAVAHARIQFILSATAPQLTYQGTSATEQVSISGTSLTGGNDRTLS